MAEPMTTEQYNSINQFLATNPTADALAAAQQQYGVSDADLAAARAYGGTANTAPNTPAVTPAVTPINDWMPNQFYNPNVMPENFDWQRYIGANQDLGAAGIDTQQEAERHYFNYGRNENRNIGAIAPTKVGDLSPEDYRAGLSAYRQATGDNSVLTGVNGEVGSAYDPVNQWIQQNYIPQGKFVTDYSAAKPADTFQLLNEKQTSSRPPDQLASIRAAWDANKDKPHEMRKLMEQYGVTLGDLSQATGETYNQLNNWVKNGNLLGSIGFSVNQPGAYDKFKKTTTPTYDPNSKLVAGPSTAASREADYLASQQRAKNTFDPVAYAKDPEAYAKKMREEGGLPALVAEKAVTSRTGTQTNIPAAYQPAEKITPANFQSEYDKMRADPNLNEDQQRKFLESALADPTIKDKLGSQLQPALDELNRPPRERMLDQIGGQQKALGGQYYQGVFGDPKVMADILEKKGVKSLADLGQKDKTQTATAETRYTTNNGLTLKKFEDGKFGYVEGDGEDGQWKYVPKDQVKTTIGKYETTSDGETGAFKPLSEKELATLKDGKFQDKIGTVVINKRTGEELTDTTGELAFQSSSGGLKEKKNYLNVNFDKNGNAVLTASSKKAGLGAALQDAMPIIAMALPVLLPGIGSAISSGLASAGGSALAAGSLANTALTQGIISGGLGSLNGADFGKSFLGGAVSPVISSGIGSLLPAGMDPNISNTIRGIGTNVISGALQGGDFKDLLGQGILSGLTNYGLGEATKSLGLTPGQSSLASGIISPLIQGQKINPVSLIGRSLVASAQDAKSKEEPKKSASGGLLDGPVPVKLQGNYNMDPRMFTGIAGNLMARSR
jgi:hypothetical protein